ncbi:MAG: hypothetical protein HY966_00835 [Ignavibacteriales bacterium]|nr:hypothetical protein [Ignavibacteriales bacterium]
MTTKPPASVLQHSADSLEKIAYSVVADIITEEPSREPSGRASGRGLSRTPNEQSRLGYNVWTWLRERHGTLEQAVRSSGVRTSLSAKQVYQTIAARLKERGIDVS